MYSARARRTAQPHGRAIWAENNGSGGWPNTTVRPITKFQPITHDQIKGTNADNLEKLIRNQFKIKNVEKLKHMFVVKNKKILFLKIKRRRL